MIEWKKVRKHRHIVADGKAICGVFGGYSDEDAVPCETCLSILFRLQQESFPEVPADA